MKQGCVVYHHRHGIDVLPFQIQEGSDFPEINNDLLKKLGVDDPELGEREDEYAEWHYFLPIDLWPVI
jgi:hypothetical protein